MKLLYTRREIVRTTYDAIDAPTQGPVPPSHNLSGYTSSFTAGQVATVIKYSSGSGYGGYQRLSQSWYSYDELGRLKWFIQQTVGSPARTIDYSYDSKSNISAVCFQRNVPAERLTHYYTYDSNSSLNKVETGQDDPASPMLPHTEQARYEYYLHGPLKRIVVGQDLQGIDYNYTVQGWLKSINDGDLRYDPAQDGTGNTLIPDLFGITLQYYAGDYRSRTGNGMQMSFTDRFDGNISGQSWQTPQTAWGGYRYQYDQLGQLKSSEYGSFANYTARMYGYIPDNSQRYQENNLNYDSNGNLSSLRRTNGAGWFSMDATYDYMGANANTNRLTAVKNIAMGTTIVAYTYDELGQMTGQQEQDPAKTKYLEYDATGKVTAVFRDAAKSHPLARYAYNEFGSRIIQQVYSNDFNYQTTYYVYDPAGNQVATYYYNAPEGTTDLYEQPIYGATRLGIYRRARDQEPVQQLYELNDQLGNTRIVFRRPTTTTYLLTMENSRVQQEKQDFPDPAGVPIYDQTRNGIYARPSADGSSYSVGLTHTQRTGPGKQIAVAKGDKLTMEVWAFYPDQSGPVYGILNKTGLATMAVIGTPKVQATSLPDGRNQSKANNLLSRLSLGLAIPTSRILANAVTQVVPNAAMQYVYKKPDGTFISNGTAQVTGSALGNWVKLQLSLTADQAGTVDVSLNSYDGTTIYFDDLKIDYNMGPIVEENHFYAYGQRNEGLSWTRQYLSSYGHGYQGKYSKFDTETGYNSFDLRMYDARVGRWISTDPYGQFHSPYVGMGNNPINSIDPDGGYSKWGATWRHAIAGGDPGDIYERNGEWGFANRGQADFGVKNWPMGGAEGSWAPSYFEGYGKYMSENAIFSEPEIYGSAQYKFTIQKKGSMLKAVAPYGIQVSTLGGYRKIDQGDGYLNIKAGAFDLRASSGENGTVYRALGTFWSPPSIKGRNREASLKGQLDFQGDSRNIRTGVRAVGELKLNSNHSVELNAGFRTKFNVGATRRLMSTSILL